MATFDHDGYALEGNDTDERARCEACSGLLTDDEAEAGNVCVTCEALRDLHEVNNRLQAKCARLSDGAERMESFAREAGVRQ